MSSAPLPPPCQTNEHSWLQACDDPGLRCDVWVNRFRRVEHRFDIRNRVRNAHILFYIYEHVVCMTAGGVETVLQPNSFMWLTPGITHSLGPPDRGFGRKKVRLVHIVTRVLQNDQALAAPQDVLVAHGCKELHAPMRMLHEQLQLNDSRQASLTRHLLAVISQLAFRAQSEAIASPSSGLDYQQAERLRNFIARHPVHTLHPRDLAKELGLSHDYFSRLFKRRFGMPPRQWLHRQRLDRAADLLCDSDLTVTDIASRNGYGDIFAFSKQFKAQFGQSPSAYRRYQAGWNED